MARFLFTTLTSNDLGLLTRTLPIAQELAGRGHQVAFCNPARAPSILLAEAGLDNLLPKHPMSYLTITGEMRFRDLYRQLSSAQIKRDFGNPFAFLVQLLRNAPIRLAPVTSDVWDIDHLWAISGMLNRAFIRSNCDAWVALIQDYQPDVIVDSWNLFAGIAAKVLRKPIVTIIQVDMHPQSRGFIWWKDPVEKSPTPVLVVNQVLASYGLAPITTTADFNVGDLTLVLGIPETDPLPDTAGVTYIGPILWQKPGAVLPDWVNALGREKPLVWVYTGNPQYFPVSTLVDSMVVLKACIEALATEDVRVVLTTGHHALPKDVLPLPNNFWYAPYVPGVAMARRSDLLIHHGGYGSCQLGLYTGTPAVIIPTYSERESNARRVAAAGAGEFIVPSADKSGGHKAVSGDELRAKVRQVLTDSRYAAGARRISEKMQAYGGACQAANLIEDFCRTRGTG